jgi:hypothetical protein
LDGIGEVLSLLAPYIGPMIIAIAAFSYLLAQYFQRKIFPRVEYHRKGPNAETYPCVELGNRVMFETGGGFRLFGGKKKDQIAAVLRARPEIKVFGFKTIRLHHVIEGFNETVDIRDIKTQNPMGGGALAVSEAVMATAYEQMAKSIPKGKGDVMINVVMVLVGLGWGLLIGVVFA